MPTTFLGLFLFSTALALICTSIAVLVTALVRLIRSPGSDWPRIQ
jgi:hypothetical protein